jgi:hypothetical protein
MDGERVEGEVSVVVGHRRHHRRSGQPLGAYP